MADSEAFPLRDYAGTAARAKKPEAAWRLTGPGYIEKSLRRLAVLEDVPALSTRAEIEAALDRWRGCLLPLQGALLEKWLAGQ